MRQIIFAVACCVVAVPAKVALSQSPTPAWRPLLTADDNRIEIDRRSIEIVGSARKVWLRWHQPDILDSGVLTVERREVDCAAGRSRTLTGKTLALGKSGRETRLIDSVRTTPPQPWVKGGTGSVEAQVVNAVCRSPLAEAAMVKEDVVPETEIDLAVQQKDAFSRDPERHPFRSPLP